MVVIGSKLIHRGNEGMNRSGMVLILALVVVTVLGIFGACLSVLTSTGSINAQIELERTQALYLAEAGLSMSIWELKKGIDFDEDGLGNIPMRKLGEGYYQARHIPSSLSIESTGIVNDVKRKVRIIYRGL